MATHDYVIANQSGAAFRTDLNNALAAIVSNNSNSSSPATTYAYQWWADTSAGILKLRNSANNAWIDMLNLDGTFVFDLEDGSASTPSLRFADDQDTGIYSSADNTFNVATAGVERMELSGTSTIFNEDGADTDFRIEGDTQANMFKVDAGNDRIGVGEGTPTVVFHATQFGHAFADSTSSLATVPTKSLARFKGSNNSSASLFFGNESTGAKCYLQGCNETGNGSIDILLNPFGANIGVGHVAPDVKFHIEGNNNAAAFTAMRITNGGGSANTEVRLEFENGSHKVGIIAASHDTSDMGSLIFSTASSAGSPSERMRINKDGDVAIGISSPAARLHVYKVHHYVPTDSGKATGGIHVRGQHGNAGEYGGAISLSVGDGNASVALASAQESADADVQGIGFFVHESSNGADDAVERLRLNNMGLIQAKGRAGSYFGTITSNDFHVFNNTGNGKFVMQMHQEHFNGHVLRLRVGANNNNEAMDILDYANSVQRFKISNNGDVKNTNNSYGSLSDISLKENIVDAKSQWDDIKAIKVRNFNFKETPDNKLIGVVAQEIETVCSGLVYEDNVKDPDDTSKIIGTVKNVKYSILYMKAIKALQEAITKIEVLETKVAALEAA